MLKLNDLKGDYKNAINQVVCCDCLEMMKLMPDKCVGLVLTDPPYNAGRDYENDNLNDNDYDNFTDSYLKECKRILKDNGNILVIIGVKYFQPVFNKLQKYFDYSWQFVLYKSNGMLNGKATFAKWDNILWFSKGGAFIIDKRMEFSRGMYGIVQ